MIENARVSDTLGIGAMSALSESGHAHTHWTIHRFDPESVRWLVGRGVVNPELKHFERLKVKPYEVSELPRNLLTTAGLTRLTSLLTASGGQAITNTSARIGVGNGTTGAAIGDTDLSASSGSSNRWFQTLSATYPQTSGGTITLQASFGANDANFAWNEFGIDIGAPTVVSGATVSAVLFNHRTSIAQGTKASGQVWTATATITFS